MARDEKQTYVRIPLSLLDVLQASADAEQRSLTQEIVYRLRRDSRAQGEREKEPVAV